MFLTLACVLAVTACAEPVFETSEGAQDADVRLSIRPARAQVTEGDTVRFQAAGARAGTGDAVDVSVVWEVTGGSISQEGLYTAGVSAGEYRVTARPRDAGRGDEAFVTVFSRGHKSSGNELDVRVEPSSLRMEVGDTATLVAALSGPPGRVKKKKLEWSSTVPRVATVDGEGRVRATAVGEASVVASLGEVADSVEVAVTAPSAAAAAAVERISGDGQTDDVGRTLPDPLVVRVLGADGAAIPDVTVRWSIEAGGGHLRDAEVATDATGEARTSWVLGPPAGTQRARAEVAGVEPVVFEAAARPGPATRVQLSPADLQLEVGDEAALELEVLDEYGNSVTSASATWSSSDGSVAAVDETGRVTALGAGGAVITATVGSASGTAAISVTVPDSAPDTTSDTTGGDTTGTETDASPSPPQPAGPTGSWNLVFRDEFDGTGSPDPGKWEPRMPWWPSLASGGEAQYDETGGHCRVAEGVLTLTATPDPYLDQPYTSCAISSHGKYSFTYGAVEIRAKMPGGGPGFGPAFWLMPEDRLEDPNLPYVEVDVLEYSSGWGVGFLNYFWSDDIHQDYLCDWCPVERDDFESAFHTFGLVWEPDRLVWYVDGVEELRYEDPNVVRDRRLYLILNLAVSYYTKVDASTRWPGEFVVDYVRVWER